MEYLQSQSPLVQLVPRVGVMTQHMLVLLLLVHIVPLLEAVEVMVVMIGPKVELEEQDQVEILI